MSSSSNSTARQLPAADNRNTSPTSPTLTDENSQLVTIFFEDDYLRAYDKGDLSQFTAAYNPFAEPPKEPFPFQFPLPQIGRITMADRFPKIEDLDLGKMISKTQASHI
jgi:hypothetical protein